MLGYISKGIIQKINKEFNYSISWIHWFLCMYGWYEGKTNQRNKPQE